MSITPFFHVYHKYVFIMSNINKIRLSGQTYNIQDLNATKTVELTQAEYDALSVKDPNVFYIITDAEAGDLSNYYTKSETDGLLDTKLDVTAYTPTDLSNYYTKSETSGSTEISTALASKADTATTYTKSETDNAITAATSTKQDTLVSGTNIKTINGETLLGEGNITIQGGGGTSITIDPSLDTGSTNAVANSAITTAIDSKQNVLNTGYYGGVSTSYISSGEGTWEFASLKKFVNSGNTATQNGDDRVYFTRINDKKLVSAWNPNYIPLPNLSLVETSAITTSISSSSTDSQVPSAKALYDIVGNIETLLSKI